MRSFPSALHTRMGYDLSPKIGDVLQRKKLSTTIASSSFGYLTTMVKSGRAESVGEAVDKAVELARRVEDRATLEHRTAAYFNDLQNEAQTEELELESALSAVSQEFDFDQA